MFKSLITSTKENIGLDKLKDRINDVIKGKYTFKTLDTEYDDEVENNVSEILDKMDDSINFLNKRWIALRLIDSDISYWII